MNGATARGSRRPPVARAARWLPAVGPAVFGGLLPVLFVPSMVDSFILPRTSLVLVAGAALPLLALLAGVRPGRLALPAAAVALAAILAFAFAENRWLAFAGAYTRYESLPVRLAYLGLLAGAAGLAMRSPATGQAARHAFLLGACAAALMAVRQGLTGELPRPDGNLGQPNLLGALLAMAVPVALQSGFRRARWLLAFPILAGGLFECSSRSGWLGALVGALALLALSLRGRVRAPWGTHWAGPWIPSAVIAGAAGALVVAAALAALLLSPLRAINNDTGSARLGVWRDALSMAAARPLAGWGEEATGLAFGRFQTADWEPGNTFDRIHSAPLDLLVTQGVLGLGTCAWLWAVVLRAGLRERARAPVAVTLAMCLAYSAWALLNFDWAPATGAAWLFAGVLWGEAAAPQGVQVAARRSIAVARAAAAAVVVAVTAVASGSVLAADLRHYAGDDAGAAGLDPVQAQYHRSLADRLTGAERVHELEVAGALGAYDYAFYIALGDAERDAGHREAAIAAYRRAEQVYRFNPEAAERLTNLGAI